MKVLLISNAFPNSAEPVRGIFTYQIVKALQKKCDIEVVAPLPWVPFFLRKKFLSQYPHSNVSEKERIGDIQVYHPRYLVIPKVLGFMHPIFMLFPLLWLLRKIERRRGIDLINAHWIFPDGVAAAWASRIMRKPVILTALGCDINSYPKVFSRRAQISSALHLADAITAKSNSLKKRIVEMKVSCRKVTVIPNGVNSDLFRIMNKKRTRRKLGISENRNVVITVGSQDDVKGTRYLIGAIALMRKKLDQLPLLFLIGDGPLRKDLQHQAIELGISENVKFLGKLLQDQIPQWLNAADVFCLPSLREGHPNVVLEALACGIPVVGSRVGSIPELIDDHNGKVFNIGDSLGLCNQLMLCFEKSWNRFIIRESVQRFNWNSCAESYCRVFLPALSADLNCIPRESDD